MLKPFVIIGIILILALLVSDAFLGQFSSLRLIDTRGNIQSPPNIGVYQDSNATSPVSYIDWGSIEPGLTKNVTIYIRNEGERKVNLSLDTTDWKPANISNHMNLTWTYKGATLLPHAVVKVTLTLWASPSSEFTKYLMAHDVKDFSFDIIIDVVG